MKLVCGGKTPEHVINEQTDLETLVFAEHNFVDQQCDEQYASTDKYCEDLYKNHESCS